MNLDAKSVMLGKIIATKSLVKKQAEVIKELEGELAELASGDVSQFESKDLQRVGRALRDFHICIENALGFIAHNFDDGIPKSENVHYDLLTQMSRESENVRPAVIDKALVEDLKEYLKFRLEFESGEKDVLSAERVGGLLQKLKTTSSAGRQQLTDFFDEVKKYHDI